MSEINYEALDESIEYLDLVSEGVNAELWKGSHKYKKEFREATKAAKKACKEKRYADAKSALKDASKIANEYAKFIDGIKAEEGDYFTTVVGWLVAGINDFTIYWKEWTIYLGGAVAGGVIAGTTGTLAGAAAGKAMGFSDFDAYLTASTAGSEAASIGSVIGALPGMVLTIIKTVKETIKEVKGMISSFKKDKDNGVDAMNRYRVQCKNLAKDFATMAEKSIKAVDEIEKADKANA